MSRIGSALCTVFIAASSLAQDIHFSQFFNTPLATSPGAIGNFDGQYRFSGIYRQQWRSVTKPYRTFGFGADAADVAGKKGLGAGIWLFNDKAGDSRLNTFRFDLGGSYSHYFGTDRAQRLTLGLQLGITSITIKTNDLSFDSQYNGFYYDPSLDNGENFGRAGLVHPNLHSGVVYSYQPQERQRIEAGISFFNLTRPKIGFLGSPAVPLDIRTTLHVIAQMPLGGRTDLLPMIQYMAQGPFREFDLGASFRYILLQKYGVLRAVRLGGYWRASDAGYIFAGIEYDDWTAGVSYDINVSDLVPASRNRGGIEFSVIRILRAHPPSPVRFKACPVQL